jgi:murein DD-endopeptidase MepM/ murein hydrolase activator NlpD
MAAQPNRTARSLSAVLKKHRLDFHPVVPFDPQRDRLYPFDFTERNTALSPDEIADTERFAGYINRTLQQQGARYGIGGYGEHRTLYARSKHFDQPAGSETRQSQVSPAGNLIPYSGNPTASSGSETARTSSGEAEPRRLHLGVDIWGPAGTPVMSPLDGIVHSYAFNNNDSDYGTTIILTHNLDGSSFHTLYGHLSLNSIKNLYEGKNISKGEVIAEFGMRFENGNWPSHLHFQLIEDMQGWKGDYPGVCRFSERQQWLDNCPDPNLVLQMQ